MGSHSHGNKIIVYYFELDNLVLTMTSADDQDEKIVKVDIPGQIKPASALNLLHVQIMER